MSIDWSKAPEGATHFGRGDFWYKVVGLVDVYWWNGSAGWCKSGYAVSSIATDKKFTKRPTSTGNPVHPKRLTQAVFDGLPSEYRWAAVDQSGVASAYAYKPIKRSLSWDIRAIGDVWTGIDKGYDATNWQNSLIERQDVSNRVEQLCSIEAARQVEATLAERQNQYGDFSKVAGVSQHLQSVIWAAGADFDDVQREAMQMICSKLARLACGDADHVDSWHDIAGYATLVVKDLESGK